MMRIRAFGRARDALDQRIELWVAEMTPDFLTSTMVYANTKGVQRAHPAWQAMTHFFNHQTHHRGQVHAGLTSLGKSSLSLDLIYFVRSEGKAYC